MKRTGSLSGKTRFNAAVHSALTLALLAATGCTGSKSAPTPVNFTQALNAYFLSRPACLLPNTRFPYETTGKVKTRKWTLSSNPSSSPRKKR